MALGSARSHLWMPTWAGFASVLFAVLYSACPPTNQEEKSPSPNSCGLELLLQAGVCCPQHPGESHPACAPQSLTCRERELTWLLCWSSTLLARTFFALVTGCLPSLFLDFLALLVLSPIGVCWFFTAGRPHLSSESWGHTHSSLQSLLHSTSVFSVV